MAQLLSRVSGAIYGTLAMAVLLAAESAEGHTYATTVEAASVTLIAYWLAHGYARGLAARLVSSASPSRGALLRSLGHESGVLLGGVIPLLTLAICGLGGVDLGLALDISVWTAAGSLVVVELVAGLHRNSRARSLVQDGVLSLALGASVVFLRVLLH